jgi:hypothetical protein
MAKKDDTTPTPEEMKRLRKTYEGVKQDMLNKKGSTAPTTSTEMGKVFKKGGSVKSSASRRADGIAQRGKTRGRVI